MVKHVLLRGLNSPLLEVPTTSLPFHPPLPLAYLRTSYIYAVLGEACAIEALFLLLESPASSSSPPSSSFTTNDGKKQQQQEQEENEKDEREEADKQVDNITQANALWALGNLSWNRNNCTRIGRWVKAVSTYLPTC